MGDAIEIPEAAEIEAAAARIAAHVRRTPILSLDGPAEGLGPASVTLKLEQLQHTASFKARGAFNALLAADIPEAGVVAASGGNHGAAVAFAARRLGIPAEIFVPEIASPAKIARLESYGTTLRVVGKDFAEALEACEARRQETGARLLHAYDQSEIVAGQGTVAAELEAQAPDLDTVLVAVGGGGLIAGIASWYRGRTKIVAVETEGTPALSRALAAGAPQSVAVSGLAADSLGARQVGGIAFAAARAFVAESLLVPDEAVRTAQHWLWQNLRLILEPGGATAFAAVLSGAYRPAEGERVAVLLCGGNADPAEIAAP